MKRKFIFLVMLFALLGGVNFSATAQEQVIEIGNGTLEKYGLPVYEAGTAGYAFASVSQQIYLADEIGVDEAMITSISFQLIAGNNNTRNIAVYMQNTDKSAYTGNYDMINVSESDIVYDNVFTFGKANDWVTIVFDNPFEYTGSNIALTVYDKTGTSMGYVYENIDRAYSHSVSEWRGMLYTKSGASTLDMTALSGYYASRTYVTGGDNVVNNIKLTYLPSEANINVSENSVNLGNVRLGSNYWSDKESVSHNIVAKAIGTTISKITCDNDFFTLNYDLNTKPVVLNVSYDKNASVSGAQNGIITITSADCDPVFITVTANPYTPAQGDIWENPIAVTFTDNIFTDSPTGIYDDYKLPGEVTEGSTPDAVYNFTMDEGTLTVNVEGTNATAAIYKAEDLVGNGPSLENNYGGIVPEPTLQEMEIHITGETTSTSKYIPFYEYYENSISQQIYTADEMQVTEGVITSIAFQKGNSTTYNRTWEIYLCNTDKQSFTGASDWVNMSAENLVFSGTVTLPSATGEWLYIELDTPFEYEGENILLCVNDKSGKWYNAQSTFTTYTTTQSRTIYYYRDSTPYDATNITTSGATMNDVNVVKFNGTFAPKSRSLARSTEPQINGVLFPAGEYYLVAAAEDAFTVSIKTGSLPAPGEFAYTAPADGATEQNNPKLTWEAAQYATKYQVFLGTESTELELVAEVETPSYQTEGLLNNTQYFWRVDAVNAIGTTKGMVYSFVTPLDVPQNLVAANIYEGETTTLTWDAIKNAKYNVYVDGEKVNAEPITATSYELTGLAYNTSGYNVTVTAVHTLGESPKSAAVNVKVAGKFTLVLNVKNADEEAIADATVTFNTESFYNEFYELVPAIEAMTTNADGMISIELPLPCVYGAPLYTYSSLGAIVTKESYGTKEYWIYSGVVSNGVVITGEVVLELAKPAYLEADSYQLLAGDTLVMAWDAVTGAIGYNIYKGVLNEETYSYDYELLNEEMLSDTTYTINGVEYGMYVQYAVTAVYAELGESSKTTTSVSVTGMGEVEGTVTDGTNPVKGVKVVLTGYDETYTERTYNFTTDAEGKFYGEVMVGYDYTARATRYDYEDAEQTEIKVEYGGTTECTIVMTSYPSATIAVTATESGNNALVSWTADYEEYNVYRRNAETDAIEKLASNVTLEEYQDTEWASLENGTYQYGVSAYISEETRGATILYQDDFESYGGMEVPTGWTIIGNQYNRWFVSANYKNSGDKALWSYYMSNGDYYVVMPGQYNPATTTLSFYYRNDPYDGETDKLRVCYSTSLEGPWTKLGETYNSSATVFAQANVTFEQVQESSIYIAFCLESVYANGVYIDDIVVTGVSKKESTITWSNELAKKSALTFNNEAKDNDWSNVDNWDGGVLPTANDNVIVAAEANINGVVAVNNLTISDAKLNVKSGTLTVNGTITDSNQYGSLYFEDGAQIFQNNEGVNAYFRMKVENPTAWDESIMNGWQFISSPLLGADIASAATKYDNAYNASDYDLYKYNGTADLEWVNHKSGNFETTFEQGRGYMYSHQARTIVTLGGTLNPARTHEYEVSYTEGEGNELANLHLLGNPFTFNMNWAEVNVTNVYDGFATLNAAGDGYVYATEGTINVGDGFFVQATGSDPAISYEKTRGSKETAANINVIARGIAGEDNVIINFAGEGEGFSKLQGFNKDKATVFVANNGRRYGIANVDENATEVELSFVASQMGNYSISLDVNGEFETVTLVDRFTGIETNMLLEDEYNFTATSRDNANRFVVRLVNRQQTTDNSQFVYQSGEELILSIEGTVQIIDMLGRVVYSNEHSNGSNRISVSEFNNAAYVVRVVNEEGVKSQKVVIY